MKFAIVSDLHLGYNDDALPQAEEALSKALGLEVDFILMPGDLMDRRQPKQEVIYDAVKLFQKIREKGKKHLAKSGVRLCELKGGGEMGQADGNEQEIRFGSVPLLAIPGTHERRSKGLVNLIQIFDSAHLMVNFHNRKIVVEKAGEKVCVQGIAGVPDEYLRRTLEVAEFKPEAGYFNVFAFHQSMDEFLSFDGTDFITLEEMPAGFDLYVNGHIHWRHELNKGGRHLLVPGSTVITQMKANETKPKGFYVYDTKTRKAEFHEIMSRPFHMIELEFNAATSEEVLLQAHAALKKVADENLKPQVRLILKGKLRKGLRASSIDFSHLQKEFFHSMSLYLEREFEAEELKEKIELLRKLRTEKKGAKELGMEILRAKMKEKNLVFKDAQEEELFELLAEGEMAKAAELF